MTSRKSAPKVFTRATNADGFPGSVCCATPCNLHSRASRTTFVVRP